MKVSEEGPIDTAAASGGTTVPRWLVVVFVTLVAWGVWYLLHFWRGPGGLAP